MSQFTAKNFRYPSSTETNNPPRDIQKLAEDIDARIPGAVTSLERSQLASNESKGPVWLGRIVYDNDQKAYYIWNGSKWVRLPWTRTGFYTYGLVSYSINHFNRVVYSLGAAQDNPNGMYNGSLGVVTEETSGLYAVTFRFLTGSDPASNKAVLRIQAGSEVSDIYTHQDNPPYGSDYTGNSDLAGGSTKPFAFSKVVRVAAGDGFTLEAFKLSGTVVLSMVSMAAYRIAP